mmetsp:Transcript_17081/g.36081  ORF Transcript_17081/g.36081 Transcript_17081/m.36081 type:complete len:265 (+) Transcript_17081:2727-3521(+)
MEGVNTPSLRAASMRVSIRMGYVTAKASSNMRTAVSTAANFKTARSTGMARTLTPQAALCMRADLWQTRSMGLESSLCPTAPCMRVSSRQARRQERQNTLTQVVLSTRASLWMDNVKGGASTQILMEAWHTRDTGRPTTQLLTRTDSVCPRAQLCRKASAPLRKVPLSPSRLSGLALLQWPTLLHFTPTRLKCVLSPFVLLIAASPGPCSAFRRPQIEYCTALLCAYVTLGKVVSLFDFSIRVFCRDHLDAFLIGSVASKLCCR